MSVRAIAVAAALLMAPAFADAQGACAGTSVSRTSVSALADCLGDPNPQVRDAIAFESLSTMMRAGALDAVTLRSLKDRLLTTIKGPALLASFSALTLAEVARTDRIKAWMAADEREAVVRAASQFLSGITDYRAFTQSEGYLHGVAHGADLTLQLALNPEITRPQLDRLLSAIALQIIPKDPTVAYWAGESDRLARAVIFIAQRKLHSDDDWKVWFGKLMDPSPMASWDTAFTSERGIRKHHNARAFLLSVFASATTSDDEGIRQLLIPARESLKLVP